MRCVVRTPVGTPLAINEPHLAERAVTLLDEHTEDISGSSQLSSALAAVVASSNLSVRLGLEDMQAPKHVVVAMTRAVSEALRNVELHSGENEALLLGTQEADGAKLIKILDDGVGFTPSTRRETLGLTRSVVERLSDIGGTVRVVSAPERGTTVSLRWSAGAPQVRAQRMVVSARASFLTAVLPRPEAGLEHLPSIAGPGLSITIDPEFVRITSSDDAGEDARPRQQ